MKMSNDMREKVVNGVWSYWSEDTQTWCAFSPEALTMAYRSMKRIAEDYRKRIDKLEKILSNVRESVNEPSNT